MTRPLRVNREKTYYHVTARGNEGRPIFRDVRDRSHFCDLLAGMAERYALHVQVYVLMDNHYHLIVQTEACNLSQAMQWLNVSYSVWFNRSSGSGSGRKSKHRVDTPNLRWPVIEGEI